MGRCVCGYLVVFLLPKDGDRSWSGFSRGPCDPVPWFKRSVFSQIKPLSAFQIRAGLQCLAVGSRAEVFPARGFFQQLKNEVLCFLAKIFSVLWLLPSFPAWFQMRVSWTPLNNNTAEVWI